ncbi:MAG: mannonate dehydratase [Candidatus Hydrogenedentota bacterium]
MYMTMRWFGADDPVPLEHIRQVPGMDGVVSALYDIPVGEVWPKDALAELKGEIEDAKLSLEVIESIPIHDSIKLGRPDRDEKIDAYCQSVSNMGEVGIPLLCYNFMPVFDWTRTNLKHPFKDGSHALSFSYENLSEIDLSKGSKDLPGWAKAYGPEELDALLNAYRQISRAQMWDNLAYFLEKVVPVAEEAGVHLAIHPDDPPWSIFGLPRIIVDEDALAKVTGLVDSPYNGLTLCTGSLGASRNNHLVRIIKRVAPRINFVHMRNVKVTGHKHFHECPHPSRFGSIDMLDVMTALANSGYTGPIRPDHGRMIWGEQGRPGYGLFDRALGAMYLQGLREAALFNAKRLNATAQI